MVGKIFVRLYKEVTGDILHTKQALSYTAKYGKEAGRRCARINNKSKMQSIFAQTTSVRRNLKFNKDDIPAIAAVSSSFVPLPGTMFVGYGVGKVVRAILKYCGK